MKKEKKLFSNYIYNTIFTCLNLLFPIITLPYISRIIGVDGIGKVNFSNSIVNYFLMIASLGIPLYGVREIARVRNDKEKLSNTFSEIFSINILSTIFCIISYYLMIFNLNYFNTDKMLFIVSGFSLILNIINLDWFYQGIEEYRYIAIRSSIVKMTSIILLFIFVKNRNDYITYAFINVLAISGNNVINAFNVRKNIKISFKNLDIKKRIKPIAILLSIQIAINIYANLDTTMCGILAGQASVGYYSNAVKINRIIVTVVISISTILLPRLSFYAENNNMEKFNEIVDKVFKIILFISLPIMIGVFFISKEIMLIMFGEQFISAVNTLKILSPLIVVLSIGNLFGTQVLIPLGKEKKLLISVVLGSITNFALNLLLIPIYKQDGAAFATVVAETMIMIVQVYFAKRFIKIKINVNEILNIIITNVLMIICLIMINKVINNIFVNFALSVIIGGSVYIVLNLLLKNNILIEVINKFKKIKM